MPDKRRLVSRPDTGPLAELGVQVRLIWRLLGDERVGGGVFLELVEGQRHAVDRGEDPVDHQAMRRRAARQEQQGDQCCRERSHGAPAK